MSPFERLGRLVAYKTVSEFASKLATFFILLLGARYLTTDEFGILSLGFVSGWLLGVASDFGLQIYLAREVARLPERGSALFWALLRWRIGLALAGFFVLSAVSVWLDWPTSSAAFLLVAAAQLEAAITEFVFHYFRGLERSELESSLQLAIRPAAVSGVAVGLIVHPGLFTFGLMLFLVSSLGLTAALIVGGRLDPSVGSRKMAQRPVKFRESFREAAPIGLGILLSGLYFRADLYLIEAWVGLQAVGLYNAVFRLLDALRLIPAAILAVVFPHLCREMSTRTLIRAAAPTVALSVVILLVLEWRAELVVRLTFGSEYAAAVPAFRVLLLALPLLYLNYFLTHQLIAWGKQHGFAVYCSLGFIANLLFNLWLIPTFGILGAAWSTIFTELFLGAAWLVSLARVEVRRLSGQPGTEAGHVGT